MFDSKISFSPHIKYTPTKATKTFNFIRCSQFNKAKAYSNMVRPILEYCEIHTGLMN